MFKKTQTSLYDRRLMILILKKSGNGRRSFSESSRLTKIKDERRYGHNEPRGFKPCIEIPCSIQTETDSEDEISKNTETSPVESCGSSTE
jgi:hypothetical protein